MARRHHLRDKDPVLVRPSAERVLDELQIAAELADRLGRGTPFEVAYVRVRRLGRIVDALGEQHAQKVLNWTARTLQHLSGVEGDPYASSEAADCASHVGFVDPDTFVVVGSACEAVCLDLLESFDRDRAALLKGSTRKYFVHSEVSLAAVALKSSDAPGPFVDGLRDKADELFVKADKIRESVLLTPEQTRARKPLPHAALVEVLASLRAQ
jgi:hypothetical protein